MGESSINVIYNDIYIYTRDIQRPLQCKIMVFIIFLWPIPHFQTILRWHLFLLLASSVQIDEWP